MNFLDQLQYTNYKARICDPILWYKKFSIQKTIKLQNNFDRLMSIAKNYKKIIVIASGPSSSLIKFSSDNLYITTNSSYLILPNNMDFIHIINDLGYLKKFFSFGLKKTPLITYLYAPYNLNTQHGYKVMQMIQSYSSCQYDIEVISQNKNLNQSITDNNIYNKLIDMEKNDKIKNPYGNSGLMIFAIGLLISRYTELELEVYGLDAGEGGKKYFDGRKTHKNHVAMRDHNKEEMGNFLEYIGQTYPLLKNYSYFKGNM